MKKTLTIIGLVAASLAGANAQIATFDTTSLTQNGSTSATYNATQQAAGVSGTPQLSRVTLTPGAGAAGSFFSVNASTSNTLNLSTNYVGFTVAPSAGNVLFATAINWTSQGSNTAPNSYATAYSTDSFATSSNTTVTGVTSTSATSRNFDIPDLITNDTLAVRFYNYGATAINSGASATGGSFRVITPSVQGSTVATAAGTVALAAATEIRNSTSLTLGGNITGAQALTKTGSGNLTLSGATNGSTTLAINAGAVQIGNGGTSGTLGSGTVTNNGTLVFNRTDSYGGNVANTIGGSGAVTVGNGTLTLTGNNSYSGATTVTAGTLLVSNSSGSGLGTSNATVNGGTLGGSGSFTGSVTVNNTGTLAPGSSIESLASGALTFNTGSTFAYEVDQSVSTSVGADLQRVSGNLTLNGTVTLTLTKLGGTTFADNTKFTLINYNGTWNGGLFTYNSASLADDSTFSFNGQSWQIDYNASSGGSNFSSEYLGSSSFVNITAVPEPGTWALIGLGSAFMVWNLRRKRSIKA